MINDQKEKEFELVSIILKMKQSPKFDDSFETGQLDFFTLL